MSDDTFEQELKAATLQMLTSHAPLEEFITLLRSFQKRGMSQETARAAVEALRSTVDEERDDRVLEILDFIVGFCAERHRIW